MIQFLDAPRFIEDHLEGFIGGGSLSRRKRGGKNIGAAGMTKIIDQILFASNVSANGGNRFAQRAHLDVDHIVEAEMFFDAASGFAEHTDRMRLIHHQIRAVLFADGGHARQIDHIAVHREDRVGDDQLRNAIRNLLEPMLQIFHVVVFEAAELRA